jgi:hypothetical protein
MCIPITRKRFFIHNLISHMHFSHVLVSMGDIPHTQTYIYIYIYYILSYYIFLYYVILYYIISYYVILCHIILYFNILYYIKWYYIAYTLHNIYMYNIYLLYNWGYPSTPPIVPPPSIAPLHPADAPQPPRDSPKTPSAARCRGGASRGARRSLGPTRQGWDVLGLGHVKHVQNPNIHGLVEKSWQ